MSRACKTRIDYRVLNSTGERILRESPGNSSSNSSGCDSDLDESDPDKTLVQSDPLPEDVILSFENLSFNTLNKSLGTSSISNLNQNSIYENIHSNELIETFTKLATHVYGLHKLIKSDTNCPGCQSPNYTKTSTTQKMDISSTDPSLVQRALGQDVDDFIEEYPTDDCEDVNEIDNCISKIEELRSIYRLRHGEYALSIDKYEESLEKKIYDERILAIKKYLFQSKVHRKSLKAKVTNSESKSCIFLINELERMMLELDKELTYEKVYFTDDQITTRKSELPQYERKLDNVSKSVKELISINKGNDVKLDNDIKIITKEYTNLCKKKEKFIDFIKDESESRELSKNELFKESKMKIQLSKFSGHDSKSDFYTFQSDFYKISRSVPKRYAADVLKNNYLEGSALALVKNLEDIDEIWERLREAYGDPKLLLKKKLSEIDSVNDLWKIKNPERVSNSLTKLINVMRDLVKLAADHGIEIKLYGGDGLDRIYRLMGDDRLTKWLISIADKDLSDKKKWTDLIIFLESDLKIQHQKVLINKKRDEKSFEKSSSKDSNYYIEDDNSKESDSSSGYFVEKDDKKCHLCDEEDHFATNGPNGIKLIQYYACRKFTELNPNERFIMLRKKGFCIQCLFPGASQEKGKHSEGKCQRDFICPHPSHEQHAVKKHVLLCHDHRNSKDNQELLVKYKERFINKQNGLPSYSKEIKLSFISSYKTEIAFDDDDKLEEAVFMLQNITVDSQEYSVFYDSGCSSMVCRYDAIQKIGSRAKQKVPGPLVINGVGNAQSISRHGEFQVKLPLFNGKDATLQGLCLDAITHKFPVYPLQGEIESDINQAFNQTKRSGKLPRLPYSVGGSEIDFMIGMKYKRYHPKEIFSLPSGLTILESKFFNPDGSRGIICGPHRLISGIEQSNFSLKAFLTNQYQLFKSGYQINPDVSFLHQNPSVCSFPDENLVFCTSPSNNCGKCTTCKESSNVYTSKKLELFQSAEDAGSEILFRCNECRDCKVCRNHKNVENISIREEVEQQLIDKSIEINIEEGYIEASLPMTHKPSTKLPPSNHDTALRVYNRVVKQLNKSPKDKEDIIRSEAEMQALGFVDYVSNLSEEDRVMLEKSAVKYYIPWLVMWKPNSLSTPCRMVLNGSFPTSTGNSLNDILPKGKKSLNNLVMIIIRWFTYFIAFHTDIRKMYNTIHLKKEYWTFQRYIWQDELDIKKIPIEKVIKTIIYGLCPSGNQSENALRGLTDLKKDEYPEVQRIIHEDTFMDDCISGGSSMEKTTKLAVNLEAVLKCGSFSLKGVTFSGKSPPPKVSCDGKMVNVAGMRWFPEDDLIALDINDLNFSKKRQGKKTLSSEGVIPEKLTRRHCASRTGELFDISGKIAPIIATFKLDLHKLAYSYKLKWDDVLPNNLREVWCSHFEMMNEIKDLRFKRAVIPEDAVSERFTTLDFGDASQKIICVAIYARYLRKNGEYSCQLLFARTKIVSPPMSQPRAELFAATVNAHTGEIVKRACSTYHEGHTKITDSQVALCWIHNTNKPLKQYVRNRVVEIRRFTEISNWRYTQSNNMIADIGTRPIKDLSLVDLNSTWQNGHSWMRHDVLPFKSIDEIILTKEDADEVQKEALIHDWISEIVREPVYNSVPSEVTSIYKFSNYLYDPNKYHRFEKVVHVNGLSNPFRQCFKGKY